MGRRECRGQEDAEEVVENEFETKREGQEEQ